MKSVFSRSPAAANALPVPKRLLWMHRLATALLILIALFWLLVLSIAAALKWYVVPNIDSLRPRLETYVSAQIQRPVQIERIVANASGGNDNAWAWLPQFEIQGLRILATEYARPSQESSAALPSAPASAPLTLGRVRVSVTPISLLQLKIDQLSIEAPSVQVRRNTLGVWSVAGFDLVPSGKPSPALDWLLSQAEILITKGEVDFSDDYLKQPTVRLSNAQLLVRNGLRSHHIRLDATPPAAWGQSLQWRGQFRQPLLEAHAGNWQAWSGAAYAAVKAPTPEGFAAYLPERARAYADRLSGTQSLAVWGSIKQGKLASVDMAAVGIPNVATSAKVHMEGWDNVPQRLSISGEAKLLNADGAGSVIAQWQQTAHPLGQLDLKAQIERFDATALPRYLNLIPAMSGGPAVAYLQSAIERGTAKDVSVRLKGELKDFPFTDDKSSNKKTFARSSGEFKVTGKLEEAQFNFAPQSNWPNLQQARAQFDLRGMALKLSHIESQWAGLSVLGEVQIANLKQPVVVVQAQAKAPAQSWIQLVNTTPIQAATNALLATARGAGSLDGRVNITVPVNAPQQLKLTGMLVVQNEKSVQQGKSDGASLQLSANAPLLSELKGSIAFSESGFALQQVSGRALGGEFKIASEVAGSVGVAAGVGAVGAITASGTASVQALTQWQGLSSFAPWLTPVLGKLQGQLPYSVRFVPSTIPQPSTAPPSIGYSLVLESNLVGLESKLPVPLSKAAPTPWPLRLEHVVNDSVVARASSPIQYTRLTVADLLDVQLQRDTPASALRGSVRVGKDAQGSAALPVRGLDAQIQLAALDADAWLKLAPSLGAAPAAIAPSNSSTSTATTTATTALAGMPVNMSAAIGQLTLANRRFDHVVLGASQLGSAWRINAKSVDLDGYFEYRTGQLLARLAHLTIPDNQSQSQLENLLQDTPSSLPALDIVVDEFELSGKQLGRLEIQAVNQRAASNLQARSAVEWRLQKLWLTNSDASFKGTGVWDNKRVDVQFALDVVDSGALLTRLGSPGTIKGGKGMIQGRVGWLGSPLAPHYPTMAGQLKLDFAKGQFLKVDPGAGRLLSLLSLQALPRLLKLDFRDVFSEGFAFDSFGGDVQINDGIASTKNLQMKSVLALVSINGQTDLAKETQDLRVLVLPDVNADGASLLATIINPVLGAVTYLTQLVLRRPAVAAATKDYHIEGTWREPKISQMAKP